MNKIAFHLFALDQGGAERVVSNLASRFAAEGYDVYLATESFGTNEYPVDARVHRVHVGMKQDDARKNRLHKIFLRILYLRNFIKEVKPDVLIAFDHTFDYRALLASLGTKVPVVISIRTDPAGHYDHLADKIQIPLLFPHAAGCVFQTAEQRRFFKPYLQNNSRVILNPINPKYTAPDNPYLGTEKSIVQSARLVGFKNQLMLIDAFLDVHDIHPDYILKIYGKDSGDGTKEQLEKLIRDRHAESCVFLMGPCGNLEQELPKTSVYALTSDWEGLPNGLMEAMAMGIPCVATDCPCGGPAEIMENEKNGLLIPIKDKEALVGALLRLIEDRPFAVELGRNARNIIDRANEEIIFQQWKEYLTEVSDR